MRKTHQFLIPMYPKHLRILVYFFVAVVYALFLVACSTDQAALTAPLATKHEAKAMVVTANPHATKAGADILRAGGSAVDAAIAIEAVLSLVEPQSSGLGGGGFMMHFDNQSKKLDVYDGRERAPSIAPADMFLNDEGESIGYLNAKHSGLATGVPGMVSMLALAHKDHGKLKWGQHFDRAKELAVDGFAVSPRLQGMIARFGKYIPKSLEEGPLDAHNYFFNDDGTPLAIGTIRTNLAYARTLGIIAKDPADFYRGELAEEIVKQISKQPRAGYLSLEDVQNFKASKREALCTKFKQKVLCGPPPSSSWVAVGAIMGLMDKLPASSKNGAIDPSNWQKFAEAQRIAYADRDFYVADNEFVNVPLEGLLDSRYLEQRAKLVSPDRAQKSIKQGNPWAYQVGEKVALGDDATDDIAGTTHFVVVDAQGNVVSLTASVESIFGTTRMAGGMFLNNQLTDFSFKPKDDQGRPIANRVEPNKRPRSSMSPTIVLDEDGEFLMATGSPGGNSIIAYTAKTLVGVLEWGLSPQDAVNLPNMVARKDRVRIEKERADTALIDGLRSYGYDLKESAGENSGLSVVVRNADGSLEGGVDPRREGVIEEISF